MFMSNNCKTIGIQRQTFEDFWVVIPVFILIRNNKEPEDVYDIDRNKMNSKHLEVGLIFIM